jgi:formylglycine-generating enzyme required for sulfatase activity
MKLKLIPPGTFTMGSNDGDPDEMPVHEVKISRPFHLGVHEVTNAQWQAVMGNVPSAWRGDDQPVETVSWTDAIAFCRTLTALPAERAAGRVYRLPTEAEWEYACRAGTKSEFSFGGDRSLLPDHAWFSSNSGGQTRPVGLKKPNPWGLYDMHGNVWEWCGDGYGPFSEGIATDPTGLATAQAKVYRGGNWGRVARDCRSAKRQGINPEHRDHYRGFRVAMDEHQER